ncbi:hypothetical protein PCA31118_01097 [Pandoraea captiosa]|uniref:PPM-type phosphatase domain-containing protein n=1 Tax=Pandoraea captiosa TaxID=2508302 RepID=A0A5E4ZQV8_9BURK|nr:hypothetical protein [Pandoraea captiosa]VVE63127.1 hypothetical protein PCA31118_01097 [Pandoraea captiosa]
MMPDVTHISEGIYANIPTEDVVGYLRRPGSVLAWAIDGASTLSESPFTTFDDISDAGWFARKVADALSNMADSAFMPSRLHQELISIKQAYFSASGSKRPVHEWPVAAATIVEMDVVSSSRVAVSIYRYADCFELLHEGPIPLDTDLRAPLSVPRTYDPWKPHSGFTGDRLSQLQARRCEQQRNELSSALTLNPVSAFNAKKLQTSLHTPAQILVGTDGLSRAWDTYGLMTSAQALRLATQSGLGALLHAVRHHEATLASNTDRKRRDDASGILLTFP